MPQIYVFKVYEKFNYSRNERSWSGAGATDIKLWLVVGRLHILFNAFT